jgi:hypothetical protein
VHIAIANKALELRLPVSSAINYALAQWLCKARQTLQDVPAPFVMDPKEKARIC